MEPIVGSWIGDRYELIEHIYTSRMSSVFKAWDYRQKNFVVVKIATNNSTYWNLVEYLKREAVALKRLNHPRVVRLLDCGDVGESYFIVLEYIEGMVLADYFNKRHSLPLDISLSIMVEVLEGLEAIHQKGLVHRDLKPDNLILNSDGVKIIDFGVAKFVLPADQEMKPLHEPGTTIGSPPYMSPEQTYDRDDLDSRSDLFACGVVLYEILTGDLPFRKFEADGRRVKLRYWVPPLRLFSEVAPSVRIPDKVKEIVWKAIAVDPDHRYQTAEEMRVALLAVTPSIFARFLAEGFRSQSGDSRKTTKKKIV